jgi:excisionase family DNA binding protein
LNITNYTTRQVAEMTGKSVETVRRWVRAGRLKGRKPPGCKDVIINKDDFEMFWYGATQPK